MRDRGAIGDRRARVLVVSATDIDGVLEGVFLDGKLGYQAGR